MCASTGSRSEITCQRQHQRSDRFSFDLPEFDYLANAFKHTP